MDISGLHGPKFLLQNWAPTRNEAPFQRNFYFLVQPFLRQSNLIYSKLHQAKESLLVGPTLCQNRGRGTRRTNSFLNFKDCTPSSSFIINIRDPHITEQFVISISFAQKCYLLTRIFSNVANHQIVPPILFNLFPTFQYRIS